MQYKFFALISRMRYIARWGLMRNTFQENIQEHSHMVASLRTRWRSLSATSSAARPTLTAARRRRCSTMRPKF